MGLEALMLSICVFSPVHLVQGSMIAHRRFRFGPRLLAISALFALAPGAAMAYIDPGTGAYMVQAIFTIVGAALFYLRHPSRLVDAITRWVRGRSKDAPSAPGQDAE